MTLREKIEVMLGAEQGKKIQGQRRATGSFESPWALEENPDWNWAVFDFRLKPEPLEGWVNQYEAGPGSAFHDTREAADKQAGPDRIRCVHMREVE